MVIINSIRREVVSKFHSETSFLCRNGIFPCEILPSLCNVHLVLPTCQKLWKTCMYSWSRQQIVLCQAIQASQRIMSGGLIQIQEGMSSKTRMEHWCIQFSICHYSLYTLWFVGHPIFQLESILMTITLNQTTRGQTLWRSVHLETDITTCSHIAEIDNSAFSDACKSHPFPLRKMAIASSQAGQVLIYKPVSWAITKNVAITGRTSFLY